MAGPARRKSLKTLIKEVTVGLANTFRNNINENNKNILFLMKGFGVGGQEVVTSVLSKAFLDDGYGVSIVFLSELH